MGHRDPSPTARGPNGPDTPFWRAPRSPLVRLAQVPAGATSLVEGAIDRYGAVGFGYDQARESTPLRALAKLAVALATISLALLGIASASSAQDDGQAIIGQLRVEDDTGERVPVEGVTVSIDGQGEAVTDADGQWSIPVDAAGTYSVALDTETLPEGVSLRDASRATLEVLVEAGQDKRALFGLIIRQRRGRGSRRGPGRRGAGHQRPAGWPSSPSRA